MIIEGAVELAGMLGNVPILKPRVSVSVSNINGVHRSIMFTVDTGFTGHSTIPPDVIRELDVERLGSRTFRLASDAEGETDLYLAFFESVPIIAHQVDAEPLLGAAMMNERRLTVDFWEGGQVTIEPRAELL